MTSKKIGPCRRIKYRIVSQLFPIIKNMGFEPDEDPPHWFGWDLSTGSYMWEFRRCPDNHHIDLMVVDLICSHLIVQCLFRSH